MIESGILARLVLVAAIAAGASYVASWGLPLNEAASLTWKGAGVGLLAVHAGLVARDRDGWLICAVMAFGALGDVLLGAAGLTVGAVAFLVGHVLAIVLYLLNRRPGLSGRDKLLALAIVPVTVGLAYLLPGDRSAAPGVALYATGLSLMAAAAWTSAFSRRMVGAGALMFVVSDLLIFARTGPLADSFWVGLAVWGLYFLGQTLICLGVTRVVLRRHPA